MTVVIGASGPGFCLTRVSFLNLRYIEMMRLLCGRERHLACDSEAPEVRPEPSPGRKAWERWRNAERRRCGTDLVRPAKINEAASMLVPPPPGLLMIFKLTHPFRGGLGSFAPLALDLYKLVFLLSFKPFRLSVARRRCSERRSEEFRRIYALYFH
jgi:hypothetical protein